MRLKIGALVIYAEWEGMFIHDDELDPAFNLVVGWCRHTDGES